MSFYGYPVNPLQFIDPLGLELTTEQQNAIQSAAEDWSKSNVPYLYGGATKTGADCSGAISSIYKQAGINIGRLTSDQFTHDPCFTPVNGEPTLGDVGHYTKHVVLYGGSATGVKGRDVWSASHTGGPVFRASDKKWFGTPTWYRYSAGTGTGAKLTCGSYGMLDKNGQCNELF